MSDIQPYGVTQNADADLATANALVGERYGIVQANAVAGSAAMFSTAPYVPPRPVRQAGRDGKCRGKNDKCEAPPVKGSDLCIFHMPQDRG